MLRPAQEEEVGRPLERFRAQAQQVLGTRPEERSCPGGASCPLTCIRPCHLALLLLLCASWMATSPQQQAFAGLARGPLWSFLVLRSGLDPLTIRSQSSVRPSWGSVRLGAAPPAAPLEGRVLRGLQTGGVSGPGTPLVPPGNRGGGTHLSSPVPTRARASCPTSRFLPPYRSEHVPILSGPHLSLRAPSSHACPFCERGVGWTAGVGGPGFHHAFPCPLPLWSQLSPGSEERSRGSLARGSTLGPSFLEASGEAWLAGRGSTGSWSWGWHVPPTPRVQAVPEPHSWCARKDSRGHQAQLCTGQRRKPRLKASGSAEVSLCLPGTARQARVLAAVPSVGLSGSALGFMPSPLTACGQGSPRFCPLSAPCQNRGQPWTLLLVNTAWPFSLFLVLAHGPSTPCSCPGEPLLGFRL